MEKTDSIYPGGFGQVSRPATGALIPMSEAKGRFTIHVLLSALLRDSLSFEHGLLGFVT